MRLSLRAGAALAACLTFGVQGACAQVQTGAVNAPRQALYTGDSGQPQHAAAFGELADDIQLTACSGADGCGLDGGCDLGCCDEVGYGTDLGCGDVCGSNGRCGQFFVGGEYMQIRANPSESIAYLCRDSDTFEDVFTQFDFSHDGAYRLYGGYRLCNCGEEIRFTYTSFDSGSSAQSPAATSTQQYLAPLEVIAVVPGQSVSGRSNVSLDSYDVGFSKTIPLGSPMGGCDPCNPCWCPAWDLTWTAAFRYADFDYSTDYFSHDASGNQLRTGRSRTTFDGVGGRMGLLGRRYLGRNGVISGYLKGDLSILIGDIDNSAEQEVTGLPDVARQTISCHHLVPVTEIEAGLTASITCNTQVSAGYLLAAWHDLGGRDQYTFPVELAYDDANIMGFDGWFVRLESAF